VRRVDWKTGSFTQRSNLAAVITHRKRTPAGRFALFVMVILWTVIIGLIVGTLAKFLMAGKDPGGFVVTISLGIAGSLIAGIVGRAMHWYTDGQAAGFIAAVAGAILLLFLYRIFYRRTA
jgi:uncharacterized membrane protein YeaQ/YmgE (transglycosylase-associated protein family)